LEKVLVSRDTFQAENAMASLQHGAGPDRAARQAGAVMRRAHLSRPEADRPPSPGFFWKHIRGQVTLKDGQGG